MPHETYGSHLNNNGQTIDTELELRNFEAAGNTLADIWRNLVIDGYPVLAEYIPTPPPPLIKQFTVSAKYKSRHVIETRYMTVVIKCDDLLCCSVPKTQVKLFFPNQRIPALIPIKFAKSGLIAEDMEPDMWKKDLMFPDFLTRMLLEETLAPECLREKFGSKIPYDAFFPSQQDKVEKRICPGQMCGRYFASVKSLMEHKRVCTASRKRRNNVKRNNIVAKMS